MKKTKKVLVVAMSLLAATTLVSAALLTYFGEVNTTMTAKQSVVIYDGVDWYDYDMPITRDLGEVVHCTDYCYKLWIKNQACVDAEVEFVDTPEEPGVHITHYVFGDTQTIVLTMKDGEWNPTGDPITLTYKTCGANFDYELSVLPVGYSLIYYIDQPDPYVNWGRVFVLGDTASGSLNVPSMPWPDDLNVNDGAKFWLIPTADLTNPMPLQETTMNKWAPLTYYFETAFGLYIDCDAPVTCMPCYPLFATTILKAESIYCWISCYHISFYIIPGEYAFNTLVHATPIE